MKSLSRWLPAVLLAAGTLCAGAATPRTPASTSIRDTGVQAAQTVSTVTGLAISPLLGVGGVGAYQWWQTPREERAKLHWFAQPWFWIPALFLAGMVAAKDVLGTAAPTALKKPFDVAEAIENKISGLVVAGAVIPFLTDVFPQSTEPATLAAAGFAALDPASLANALLVPFAIAAFAIVWLASHAINILILLSPFTTVDAALKGFRLAILGLVTGTAFANPYLGAAVSVMLMVVAFFIAGWSFRLMVFGNLFVWDFVTLRSRRFRPFRDGNRMFTARRINSVPVRTYGWLNRTDDSPLVFHYRPWLILPQRQLILPEGAYVVGRGLFLAEVARKQGEEIESILTLPPRYCTHEQEVSDLYRLDGVREVGFRKCLKGIREALGMGKRETAPATSSP